MWLITVELSCSLSDASLGGFLFSFRVINLNNAGDNAVERERDAWIEVPFNAVYFALNSVAQGHIYRYPPEGRSLTSW